MYCSNCGKEIHDNAVICIHCGCAVNKPKANVDVVDPNKSPKDWLITLLFCFFIGCMGIHRFYVGKIGTGILMLLTLGGFGIWTFIDLVFIILGRFTDGDGKVIKSMLV